MNAGCVYLVGAGPGDPELITVKGQRLLANAEVVVYDRLVNRALLDLLPSRCRRIYVGKRKHLHAMAQADINATLVKHALAGSRVVRLKGGDPLVFGRGGEEAAALSAAGVPWEIVPGVTAATGAAASTGLALTHRDFAQAVTFVTAHRRNGSLSLDWGLVTRPAQTVVFYMGLTVLAELVTGLRARGVPDTTQFTVVSRASLPGELVVHSTLADVLEHTGTLRLESPTLLIMHEIPVAAAAVSVARQAAAAAPRSMRG